MKNKHMPIGMDSLANFKESKNRPKVGKNLPSNNPIAIHAKIHTVKYFSNMPSLPCSLTNH
jgi:hypothetical protein